MPAHSRTKLEQTLSVSLVFVIVRAVAFMDLLMFSMIILVGKLLDLYLKCKFHFINQEDMQSSLYLIYFMIQM